MPSLPPSCIQNLRHFSNSHITLPQKDLDYLSEIISGLYGGIQEELIFPSRLIARFETNINQAEANVIRENHHPPLRAEIAPPLQVQPDAPAQLLASPAILTKIGKHKYNTEVGMHLFLIRELNFFVSC